MYLNRISPVQQGVVWCLQGAHARKQDGRTNLRLQQMFDVGFSAAVAAVRV